MYEISDKTLRKTKELLQEFRDYNDIEVGFLLGQCTQCMSGDCSDCADPYQRISEMCDEIINIIDDILSE